MTVPRVLRLAAVLALVCGWCARLEMRGETVTLFPVADTTILEVFPTNNIGAFPWLNAGTTQNYTSNRALLKFDVAAALPAGATITEAQIYLWVIKRPADDVADSLFSLRRVLRSWGEGTNTDSGTNLFPLFVSLPSGPGDATWTHSRWSTNQWTAPGGLEGADYAAGFSAQAFVGGVASEPYFFEGGGATADVQLWLDQPEQNFGWMLKSEEEQTAFTARRFGSRELEDTAASPQLVITYLPPIIITDVHTATNRLFLTFNTDFGYPYRVEQRPALGGTNTWATLTNLGLVLSPGPRTVSDSLTNGQRFYRVRRN